MSDGNFNRALLPHTPYQSGLRQGKSMARMHAADVLRDRLPTINPHLTPDEQKEVIAQFTTRLSRKL